VATYVQVKDIEDRVGAIDPDDLANVLARMDEAEANIRSAFGDLAVRITAGKTTAENIAIVAANMVCRVLDNPHGLREETHPEYSYVRATQLSAGGMVLTKADRRLLGARVGATTVPIRDDALPYVAERPCFPYLHENRR
jgi:hypothetical protein